MIYERLIVALCCQMEEKGKKGRQNQFWQTKEISRQLMRRSLPALPLAVAPTKSRRNSNNLLCPRARPSTRPVIIENLF